MTHPSTCLSRAQLLKLSHWV